MIQGMRTTLDLDEDVLQAAKEMAAAQGTTAGKVLSVSPAKPSPRRAREKCATACPFCRAVRRARRR